MTSSPELDRLGLHQIVLDSFIDRAEAALTRNHQDKAASLLTIAVDVASRNHPGRFTDDRIERLVRVLAASIEGPDLAAVPVGDDGPDVVHVVSDSPTGGVEAIIDRWANCGSRHSRVVSVGSGSTPVRERAAALRAELRGATTVVVHTEPDDVTPLIALGAWERPPVVFVNHNDTVFWPGVSSFDLIVSHRVVGSALAVDRRCVPVGRTMLLPPLSADHEVWTEVLGVVEERAHAVSRTLPPPPSLPRPFEQRDVDLVCELDMAHRSDGLLGALERHGALLDHHDRPVLSVVVLARDADETVECLHRALDAWTLTGTVQLIVVDMSGDPEMESVLGELKGTALGVKATDGDSFSGVAAGLKWAWGLYAAVITDSATPMVGACVVAMETLVGAQSRSVVPIEGLNENEPDGVLLRLGVSQEPIEQVFAQVREHMVKPNGDEGEAGLLDLVSGEPAGVGH